MNPPPNIVAFNRMTVAVFAVLYKSFPAPLSLKAVDLIEAAEVDPSYAAQLDQPSSGKHNLAASTLNFLVEEGFVRMRDESGGKYFTGCVLTVKGFTALGKVPKTLETGESLGERILKPATDGAAGAFVQAIFGTFLS